MENSKKLKRVKEKIMASSLKAICLIKLADLLRANYWPVNLEDIKDSKFSWLPSPLVEHLLRSVTLKTKLSVQHIYPLLTSGKIQEFVLRNNICIEWNEFVAILRVLSAHMIQLKTLILENTYYNPPCVHDSKKQQILASAIEHILSSSRSLKLIHVYFPFDLKYIQQMDTLKNLQLSFPPLNDLRDMVPKVNGMYVINNTITHFSVKKSNLEIKVPSDELGFILQHWSGLTCVENDIAESLELCHYRELESGTLSKCYKLTKIKLGDMNSKSASASAVRIAVRTCPDVTELDVFLMDNAAMAAVSNFQNLAVLSITYKARMHTDNFLFGLNFTINTVGAKLEKLKIDTFSKIDLSIIGHFCPNLKHMEITYCTIFTTNELPYFEHLQHLRLQDKNPTGTSKEILLQFLPRCKQVSFLYLNNIRCFDDDVLMKLISLNCWPKLQKAIIGNCNVSGNAGDFLREHLPTSNIVLLSRPQIR